MARDLQSALPHPVPSPRPSHKSGVPNSTPRRGINIPDAAEQSQHDLRAASNPQKRFRAQKAKYWAFHAVHPGQLGRPHYTLPRADAENPFPLFPAPISSSAITVLSRRDLYKLAQETAPHDQHSHCDCLGKRGRRGKRDVRWLGKQEERAWFRDRPLVRDDPGECELDPGGELWVSEAISWERSTCSADGEWSKEPPRTGNRFGVLADTRSSAYDLGTLVDRAVERRAARAVREPGWIDVGVGLEAAGGIGPAQSDFDNWVDEGWGRDEDALWDFEMV